MNIVSNIKEWQETRRQLNTKTIGFVPTMGHLHEGHLSLCRRAKEQNEVVIVSIFVNPTQFNNPEDLEKYPRTLEQDIALLKKEGVDYLLTPSSEDIYCDHFVYQVSENDISKVLEGEFRPGHFTGVLTIVMKLFNLVQPTRAYFGEKDYQQLQLIKNMVEAFFMPLEVIACETVRAQNHLALSSRNSRLNSEELNIAALIPQALQSCASITDCQKMLESSGFKVDYVAEKWGRRLAAVWLNSIRLIDNIKIEK